MNGSGFIKRLLERALTLIGWPPPTQAIEKEPPLETAKTKAEEPIELDLFDLTTEEDVVELWKAFKSKGLSSGDAWSAVIAEIALDIGFGRFKNLPQSTH